MKAAIIVPCYRQAHFLPFTLSSIAGQTHTDIQTIVVDDGSDDNVEGVVYQFANVKYLRKANGGLSSARNFGIDNCRTADIFVFLDSDDLLRPRSIEMMIATLKSHPSADISQIEFEFFSGDAQLVDRNSSVDEDYSYMYDSDLVDMVLHRNLGPIHTLAYRSSLFQNARFDESFKSCEDWDINARLVLNGSRLAKCNYHGSLYRTHPSSMSKNITKMLTYRIAVLRKVIKLLAESKRVDSYRLTIIEVMKRLLRRAWYHRDSQLTKEVALLLIQCQDSGLMHTFSKMSCKFTSYSLHVIDSIFRPDLAAQYRSEIA